MLIAKYIQIFILLALTSFCFASNEDIPKILLKYNVQSFSDNNRSYLVFNFSNIPHWHTYWKNPGDAGFGPKFDFDQNESKITFSPLEWPAPKRYIEPGDIWAYGYEGDYSFFFELPKNYNGNVQANLTWLICKHICIPGKSSVDLEIEKSVLLKSTISERELELKKVELSEIKKRLYQLANTVPKDVNKIDIVLAKEETENTLGLYYNVNDFPLELLAQRNLVFPYPHPYLEFKHEKLYQDQNGAVYAKMLVEWNGMYEEPEIPFPKDLSLPERLNLAFDFYDHKDKKSYKIEKSFSKLYESKKLNSFLKILKPINPVKTNLRKVEKSEEDKSGASDFYQLVRYILFAILGGFILNFMPCVLPVISLKIFGLVNQKNQSKSQIVQHNLLYTAGVISTFLVFALIVILIKLSGQAIGWGFQMQSPTFVASIAIFLFLFSLNLFGMYEFITPGGSSLGSIQTKGPKGDFLNGVLATILSTPCSAPFLGTALAFAFTSGPLAIFLIFFSVGIGLSSPFLLTAAFPRAISLFPKPGNWMNYFKKFLGLSLLLTVFWLVSIFIQLRGDHFSLYILITLFILGPVAIIIYQKLFKNILILIFAFALTVVGLASIKNVKVDDQIVNEVGEQDTINKFGLNWNRWNPDIVTEYQAGKRLTFIDFTADWCLTCKVNEKLVINTDDFKKLVKDNQISLILGDWTDGNPEMTKWLQNNDMAGVPAYFVIDKDGNLHNLGETISIEKIKKSFSN